MTRQRSVDRIANCFLDHGAQDSIADQNPERKRRVGRSRPGTRGSITCRMCIATLAVIMAASSSQGAEPSFQSVAASPNPDSDQRGELPDDRPKSGPTDRGRKLGEKLIRQAHSDANEDLMDTILRLMGSASHRLEVDLDAGGETQALQRQIMDQLDDAIKIAGTRRRIRSRDQNPSRGDKRRRREDENRPVGKRAGSDEGRRDRPPSESMDAGGSRRHDDRPGGSLYESRRAWGQLPGRERDEIIQGSGEQYLQRFRDWIERYYRALQESGDSKRGE